MRRRTGRALLASALLCAGSLAPRAGLACAVCMGNQEEAVRAAFIGTTALLTALPLLMVGGVAWWLVRRARELDRSSGGASEER